jgi:bifunctional pyridoxal-dependent enzyme with beta-cystathionase and maltose regulon repressor activities
MQICSIIDIQSFVIAGDRGQKFGAGAKSVVRVNLGRHRYTSEKVFRPAYIYIYIYIYI